MNESDPRVKRTRKLIVDAFFALLAEKGFQAISVQDIAERATVNRATFYTHFEDKYALIDWVARDTFRTALAQRLGTASRFSLDNLRLLVVTVCEFLSQFHGRCVPGAHSVEPPIEIKLQEELAAFLLGWLHQAPLAANRANGHTDTDVPAEATLTAAASLLSWTVLGAGAEWSRAGQRPPVEEWARATVDVLVGGVSRLVTLPTEEPRPVARATPARAGAAPAAPRK